MVAFDKIIQTGKNISEFIKLFGQKEIEFSEEFVNRLVMRGIWNIFGFDLNNATKEIQRLMINDSVVIKSPNKECDNQYWVLIELDKLGLTKIPVAVTGEKLKVITIANPVTDPICERAFSIKRKR